MRVGSLFTGIGAWEKALKDFELKWFGELDEYAITSYCAIHNESENKNIGDITKVDVNSLEDIDLLVYSPPCQSYSSAGKGLGVKDKRGILFFDALRVIEAKQPKIAIMENVKGLTTKKHRATFETMLSELERVGYRNYWKVLNLKHYGLPQNRERVFIVSIRTDIDKGFEFPEGYDNGLRLKDVLEKEVDDKYYLSEDKVYKLLAKVKKDKQGTLPNIQEEPLCTYALGSREHRVVGWHEESGAVLTRDYKDPKVVAVPIKEDSGIYLHDSERFAKKPLEGYSRCLKANKYDSAIIQVGNIVDTGNFKNPQRGRIYSDEGISPALQSSSGGNQEPKVFKNYRIRKLTPLECWRLMGFEDEDFYKAKEALNNTYYNGKDRSNSKLYKQAGNSVGVTLLRDLFNQIFKTYNI